MWSKAICWIDDCRIPFADEKDCDKACKSDLDRGQSKGLWLFIEKQHKRTGGNTKGRFPANILVSDDMLNDGLPSGNNWKKNYGALDYKGYNYESSTNQCIHGGGYTGNNTYADKGSSSRYYDIDKWFDKIIE